VSPVTVGLVVATVVAVVLVVVAAHARRAPGGRHRAAPPARRSLTRREWAFGKRFAAAVQRDDELVDHVAAGGTPPAGDPLGPILAALRDSVRDDGRAGR
jgi:hypothetical protein